MLTYHCGGPHFEFPLIQSEMIASGTDVTVSILTMLALMLLTSPFAFEEENVRRMQLSLVRECVETGDLHSKQFSRTPIGTGVVATYLYGPTFTEDR